jgi:hypothetical protein
VRIRADPACHARRDGRRILFLPREEFYSCPEKGSLPRIKVGAGAPNEFKQVLRVLMHEITEFAFWRQDCRYSPDNRISPCSHADYLFVMTHEKFNDCITKVGEFIHLAIPELATAYDTWHKPKPKPKKKAKKK